jgi:glyoxylase-like metal-dependent hydrolase (beta-lactamase superfamily II)
MIETPDQMLAQRSDRYGAYGVRLSEAARQRVRDLTGGGVKVSETFTGGESIQLADDWVVDVVATPGHSPGHLALHDPKHRALYAADAIHGAVYPGLDGRPKLPPTCEQVDAYLATIDRIAGMPLDVVVGCHWPIRRGEQIAAFCEESRRFVERAEAAVLETICSGAARTLGELIAQLGPKLGGWPRERDAALAGPFAGHLDRLVRQGRLLVEPVGGVNTYRAAGRVESRKAPKAHT